MKSNGGSQPKYRSGWWLGAVVAVVAFGFGAFGLWQYETAHGGHPDLLSVVYHTLQLFILHAPHLEHATPWQLHVGRLLAAGLFFAAAGKALMRVFRNELLLLKFWLPRKTGHVVVCGLGSLGMRLARDARKQNKFVVAIEKDPQPGVLEQARANGILVFEGDARDRALLKRARFDRAEFLIAACLEDKTNVTIAALAGELAITEKTKASRLKPDRTAPLFCRLLIKDPKLRSALNQFKLFPHTGEDYEVDLRDLDLESTAIRQALREYPLDFKPIGENDDILVHLLVIGFGLMGQRMTLNAALVGHFANKVGILQKKLRITVVDTDPSDWEVFKSEYKNLTLVCDADFAQHDISDPGFVAAMDELCAPAGAESALVTYAVCLEIDEPANLRLVIDVSQHIAGQNAQVLIHQTSRLGFAALFPTGGRGQKLRNRVHVFGMEEDVFTWDVLLHEKEDKVAKAIHKNYQSDHGGKVWAELTDGMKDSNRQAADHIPVKLRAVGLEDRPLEGNGGRITQFSEKQRDLLAKMEHERWCAERYIAGWRYGKPKNPELLINDCLVTWDQLTEKQKEKDWEQIEAIPKILESVGSGIYTKETVDDSK